MTGSPGICCSLFDVFINVLFIRFQVVEGGDGIEAVRFAGGFADKRHGFTANNGGFGFIEDGVEGLAVVDCLEFFYFGDVDDEFFHLAKLNKNHVLKVLSQ